MGHRGTGTVLGLDPVPELHREVADQLIVRGLVQRPSQRAAGQLTHGKRRRRDAEGGHPGCPEVLVDTERPDNLRSAGCDRRTGGPGTAVMNDRGHPGEQPVVRRLADHQHLVMREQPAQLRAQRGHHGPEARLPQGHRDRCGQLHGIVDRHAAESDVHRRLLLAFVEELGETARRRPDLVFIRVAEPVAGDVRGGRPVGGPGHYVLAERVQHVCPRAQRVMAARARLKGEDVAAPGVDVAAAPGTGEVSGGAVGAPVYRLRQPAAERPGR